MDRAKLRGKKVIFWGTILVAIISIYFYLQPDSFDRSFDAVIYSEDGQIEVPVKVNISGERSPRLFYRPSHIRANVKITEHMEFAVMMNPSGNGWYEGGLYTLQNDGYQQDRLLMISTSLDAVWGTATYWKDRYGVECFIAGPAKTAAEAREISSLASDKNRRSGNGTSRD